MKPYQHVVIEECGEPLQPIPLDEFLVVTPHPYEVLGAPYGDRSPYWLRQSVLQGLRSAQRQLQHSHPNWQLQVFDAYRPIAVQQFMVDYTAATLATQRGISLHELPETDRQALFAEVYQFWALPSQDPKTPPPHSTGAAIDVTLADQTGKAVDMGSPIDEVSARSHPHHFQASADSYGQTVHQHRCLLHDCMAQAGFQQHPNEWWHFSQGDQLWAWLTAQASGRPQTARYGRVE